VEPRRGQGPAVFSVARTRGSWRFEYAVDDKGIDSLLHDVHWDWVVLQEQSQILSFDAVDWLRLSYPYAAELEREIEISGSDGLLFETWGYRHGVDEADSYEEMQGRLWAGVHGLADRLGVDVAPVGTAWSVVRGERPDLDLWDEDGHHPNRAGSYLAACVFYAELTGHSPTESAFTAGLDGEEAHVLQRAAAYVVRGP
jgi:hypothetical protein